MKNNNYKLLNSAVQQLLCTLVLICGFWTQSKAQVATYSFTQTSGTYTALSSGTQCVGAGVDDGSGSSQPIGFSFNYAGTSYNTFIAQSNGYIALGATSLNT